MRPLTRSHLEAGTSASSDTPQIVLHSGSGKTGKLEVGITNRNLIRVLLLQPSRAPQPLDAALLADRRIVLLCVCMAQAQPTPVGAG